MQHRSTSLMAQAETDSNSSSTKELCHLRSESEDPFIFKYNFGTWRAPGKSFTVELYQKEHLFYPQTIRVNPMCILTCCLGTRIIFPMCAMLSVQGLSNGSTHACSRNGETYW